ncbi:ferredoxin [Crossiella equi]|uniref:Ferredoxin n=2 Tax=Crossiella equi TaxID=130796 RepID=A0ABS5A653_9PSEU|nr:4Fe-4S dicluster domain-containing protein [Crossiella equi]MBP2472072.1 ferredoxin [Crossiella equi]
MVPPAVLSRTGLDEMVELLLDRGHRVIGPTVRDSAIVLDELDSPARLPSGWGVVTGPGHYRLRRRADAAVFGHSAGPLTWKHFLYPPREDLWSVARDGAGEVVPAAEPDDRPMAFLGIRGCDLAAIGALDRVLRLGQYPDGRYDRRRRRTLLIAVDCTEPGELCFCASTGTGPAAGPGYDLALTEVLDGEHRFLVVAGSPAGAELLAALHTRPATDEELASARAAVAAASDRMGRTLPAADLPTVLAASRESSRWSEIAQRCLSCGNCTMVCPTCFCTTTQDATALTGEHATRSRHWASCFELGFSELHEGPVRASAESRYRQWLTHKLGTWPEQLGGPGCVGCGRCIAWCPAGIDLTEEAAALATEWGGDAGDRDRADRSG